MWALTLFLKPGKLTERTARSVKQDCGQLRSSAYISNSCALANILKPGNLTERRVSGLKQDNQKEAQYYRNRRFSM